MNFVDINYFSFSGLVNLILSFIIGSFVLYKNPKSPVHRNFAYFCFGVALWSFGYVFWQFSSDEPQAYFWTRFLMIGAALAPLFYFTFVIQFLDLLRRPLCRYLFYSAHVITYIFILINIFSKLLIDHVEQRSIIQYHPMGGHIFIPFLLMFFAQIVMASYLLFQNYHASTGIQRTRIGYIAFGITIAFLGGATNYFLFFDATPIPPFGNIMVAIYPMAVGYAITRHRLMDIRVVLKKSLVYGSAIGVMLCAFVGVAVLAYQQISSFVVWLIAMLLVVLFQNRINRKIKRALDGIFSLDELDLSQQLRRIETTQELASFVEEVIAGIQNAVSVKVVDIFIRERQHYRYASVLGTKNAHIAFDDEVLDILHNWHMGLVSLDSLKQHKHPDAVKLTKFLKKNRGHALMRLGNILGIVIFTAKEDGMPFTVHELQQLEYMRGFITTTLNRLLEWQETIEHTRAVMHERTFTEG